jgi:TonB family protein
MSAARRQSDAGEGTRSYRPTYRKWSSSPDAAFRSRLSTPSEGVDRRRLTCALLLSLVLHALLLRLAFDGQGLGLPSLRLFWQDRRAAVEDLRVVMPAPPAPAPEAPQATLTPIETAAPQSAIPMPSSVPAARARASGPAKVAVAPKPASSPAERDAGTSQPSAPADVPAEAPSVAAALPRPMASLPLLAVERADMETWVVPAPSESPQSVAAAVPLPIGSRPPIAVERATMDSWVPPVPVESPPSVAAAVPLPMAARPMVAGERAAVDPWVLPVPTESRTTSAAAQVAAPAPVPSDVRDSPQKAAPAEAPADRAQEAARATAQREAAEQAARQEAARQEAARQEAARQEAARQEAARQEAARQEAARQEAARQEAARQEATQREAREWAERREARLREIGRQLDLEAARRDAAAAARQSPSLPYSLSNPRRHRLFGRSDPNEEIVRYGESWSQRIALGFTISLWREPAQQPYTDPVVIVAVRSDGSVESVTFERSSGVPALDEAIRRIVDTQKPFAAFPPELARDYDVVEIRRSWHFDNAVRLY